MEAIVDDLDIPNERMAWIQAGDDFQRPAFKRTELEMSRIMTLLPRLGFFQPMSFSERLALSKIMQFSRVRPGEELIAIPDIPHATIAESELSVGSHMYRPNTNTLQNKDEIESEKREMVEKARQQVIATCDFFVVVYGTIALQLPTATGRSQHILEKGESFGSPLGISALPHGARYVAEGTCELLRLTREQFKEFLGDTDEKEIETRVSFLRALTVPIFVQWTHDQFEALARAMFAVNTQSKEVVVREGDPSDAVFFVVKGKFKVVREVDFTHMVGAPSVKLLELATLSEGEYFGELGMLRYRVDQNRRQRLQNLVSEANFDEDSDQSDSEIEAKQINADIKSLSRQATVYAHTPGMLLVLPRDEFISRVSDAALIRMREYAKGYPSQAEVRAHFSKQQRWDSFKGLVMSQVHGAPSQAGKQLSI